jgi:glucose-1-phosphate thymidylyltransferase
MKIIVPMAGMGKRMRPHTLTTPKPLIPVAGKPIVQRLVEGLATMCNEKITEVAYIVGRFGEEAEQNLKQIAENLGAKGSIYYQDEPLGTAHAIMCAQESISGPVIVAFADTLFYADFQIDSSKDGVIWVHQIPDPSAFGVVLTNQEGDIVDFIEKPKQFISDLAIIGIYFFNDGDYLKSELKYLLDNDIREGGEYQITTALKNMNLKGKKLSTGKVREWLDCGNKDATVYSNQRVLINSSNDSLVHPTASIENATILQPSFIGENAIIRNSVIGPYASIGQGSVIDSSIIKNTIVQAHTKLNRLIVEDSMIGNYCEMLGKPENVSIGDYTRTI